MSIAVTGATGQLGRLVIEELLKTLSPREIVAVARDENKAANLTERGLDVRIADYGDRAALDRALAGVETLLLVSSSEVGGRAAQHRNVIDAAREAGVGRIVYTSAPRATTSALVLAPEHKATEEYLTASGIPWTILRNSWYTENYVSQVEAARQTGKITAAAGDGRVASASRGDYAAAAAAVLVAPGHESRIYELSGDVAWDYHDLAAAASEILGTRVTYEAVDADALAGILAGAGLDESTAGFVAALDQNIADGLLAETGGDLRELIGRPTTPLVEGLKAALAR